MPWLTLETCSDRTPLQCAFAHSWGKGATCFVVPRRPIYACGVNQDRPVVISPREGVLECWRE